MRYFLLLTTILFLGCQNNTNDINSTYSEPNTTSEEELVYSEPNISNEEELTYSEPNTTIIECNIDENNLTTDSLQEILSGYELNKLITWYGYSEAIYIYDKENFCMDLNHSSIKIGCFENLDFNADCGVSNSELVIFRNQKTDQYIALAKYMLTNHDLSEIDAFRLDENWIKDNTAWQELQDHLDTLPKDEKVCPKYHEDCRWQRFPQYCGWEVNKSKETE